MDFPGYDLSNPGDVKCAMKAHQKLVTDYMSLLDRYRKLPSCDDLAFSGLLEKGYPKEFLESLDTLTCLPPPGDPLYSGDESPFDAQYEETVECFNKTPEELKAEREEFEDDLTDEERSNAEMQTAMISITNTFFMLAVDWIQVGIVPAAASALDIKERLEILGLYSQASGYYRNAFERMIRDQIPCAAELARLAADDITRARNWMTDNIRKNPRVAEAFRPRLRLLDQMIASSKEILLGFDEYLSGHGGASQEPPPDKA